MSTSLNSQNQSDEDQKNAILLDAQTAQNVIARCNLNAGGLVIKAGGSAVVKTVNKIAFTIGGVLYTKASGDLAAITGTIAANKSNVIAIVIDTAGTVTYSYGTEGATLAAAVPPAVSATKAIIGLLLIELSGGATFTGGTTALDAANTTVTFVDVVGTYNPAAATANAAVGT